MRTRAEIETDWRGHGGLSDRGTTLTLEVLLDIRDRVSAAPLVVAGEPPQSVHILNPEDLYPKPGGGDSPKPHDRRP